MPSPTSSSTVAALARHLTALQSAKFEKKTLDSNNNNNAEIKEDCGAPCVDERRSGRARARAIQRSQSEPAPTPHKAARRASCDCSEMDSGFSPSLKAAVTAFKSFFYIFLKLIKLAIRLPTHRSREAGGNLLL